MARAGAVESGPARPCRGQQVRTKFQCSSERSAVHSSKYAEKININTSTFPLRDKSRDAVNYLGFFLLFVYLWVFSTANPIVIVFRRIPVCYYSKKTTPNHFVDRKTPLVPKQHPQIIRLTANVVIFVPDKMRQLVVVLAIVGAVCSSPAVEERRATVSLKGKDNVQGHLVFTEVRDGVKIEGQITGLAPGKHGFHIHAKGDLSNGCATTAGHFNPHNVSNTKMANMHHLLIKKSINIDN